MPPLRCAAAWLLPLLLAACAKAPEPVALRPALVVQANAGVLAYEAFAGEVHAREETPLAFRIGGKIVDRRVDAGARVRAGQVLADLDAADATLQSEADRAQLASAGSDLALAGAELVRYQDLAARQLVSRSLLDTRQAAFDAAAARVRQARAQLSAAGNQLGYAALRAPGAGVVTQRQAEAGQVVAAGQTVFVLALDGEREVAISVPEKDIARFTVGRALAVELWAAPGTRYPGKLREVSPAADPLTRTYAARVAFDAADGAVDLGQSARVYALAAENSRMRLPLSALTRDSARNAVWVVDARGVVHLRPIETGAYGEDGVPVRAGLRPDEWVVAAGAHLLRDGEQVLPIDRDNRPVHVAAR
jgi:multidrug efflux system membrane fusion protein